MASVKCMRPECGKVFDPAAPEFFGRIFYCCQECMNEDRPRFEQQAKENGLAYRQQKKKEAAPAPKKARKRFVPWEDE